MSYFSITQNDRLPVLRIELSDVSGVINLSGNNVYFVYKGKYVTGAAPTTGAATILSHISGLVEYSWTAADVASPGIYYGQWKISGESSQKWSSFPNESYIKFAIFPTL